MVVGGGDEEGGGDVGEREGKRERRRDGSPGVYVSGVAETSGST